MTIIIFSRSIIEAFRLVIKQLQTLDISCLRKRSCKIYSTLQLRDVITLQTEIDSRFDRWGNRSIALVTPYDLHLENMMSQIRASTIKL